MTAQERYALWLNNPALDQESRLELVNIQKDEKEIEDRFYQELQFGTAGLRGVLGVGSNRMNLYTVARAAEGFARWYEQQGEAAKKKGLAISYDSRHGSREFAQLTAQIFVQHGIQVRLSDELRPVPLLSFAIRHFHCAGGVMITASHNPKQYNGFKVYGDDGGQLAPEGASAVALQMERVADEPALVAQLPSFEEAVQSEFFHWMGEDLDQAYDQMALKLSISPESVQRHQDLSIVYTPLNGAGNKPVRRILKKLGFNHVHVVPEQENPDGDFPTCSYPNPEYRETLQLGIQLAEKEKADLLIATDPDSDRTGVAVRTKDKDFVVLSGNEIGLLLMDYVLGAKKRSGQLPENSFCATTIVSSRLPLKVCAHYGAKLYQVLTGFKFIAEAIRDRDEEGEEHFQFGYEESFGYLAGRDVRDKDAVVASLLIAEMAAESADRGETLYERLESLYQQYGYAAEKTISLQREGKVGLEKIAGTMAEIRGDKTGFFRDLPVQRILDIQTGEELDTQTGQILPLGYTHSNVLVFQMEGLDWFACRPSGTEPKLKIYMGVYRKSRQEAQKVLQELEKQVAEKIESTLGD